MKSHFLLYFLVLYSSTIFCQTPKIDSLENLLKQNQPDSTIIKIKNKLSWVYIESNNFEKALKTANEAISIGRKSKSLKDESNATNNLGSLYWSQSDYDNALLNYKKAYDISVLMKDENRQSKYIGNVGMIHILKGNYMEALEYLHISLKIEEKQNNKEGIAKNLATIGTIYKELKDFEKALEYLQKSIQISEKINDTVGLAPTYGNLANIYSEKKEFDLALKFYKKAIELEEILEDQYGLAGEYSNIGVVYSSLAERSKDPKQKEVFQNEAIQFLNRSLRLSKTYNFKNIEAFALYSMADMYIDLKRFKDAKLMLDTAIAIHLQIEAIYHIGGSYLSLSKADSALGNFQNAYENFKKHKYWSDQVLNEDNKKIAMQRHIQYEFDKKEEKLKAERDLQAAINKEERKRQYIIIALAFSIIIAITIVVFFILRTLKITRKQKRIVEIQKDQINLQKELVEEKNKEITQSIQYAQKIQNALLPNEELFKKILPDSFVLFKPKDIVSGDFYWLSDRKDYIFYATADSTGHGVPGGFMSMLGTALLNEIIDERAISDCGEVLNMMREKIMQALKQAGDSESKDGMDMVLIRIDKKTLKMQYAAANNDFYITRNQQLQELSCDKMPVGVYHSEVKPFKSYDFQLEKGDIIYTFTDGYADQFGGEKGKKYNYKQFRERILAIHTLELSKQKELLNSDFEQWKGSLEQVDDVCMIAVRI